MEVRHADRRAVELSLTERCLDVVATLPRGAAQQRAGHVEGVPRRVVLSLRLVPRTSVQRAWLAQVPEGTCFRSGDVPGPSRGAVYTFLSRESAKPRAEAKCWRVAPNLYWRPPRAEGGRLQDPGHLDIARGIAGEGCGPTGHLAGKVTGWLTHTASHVAEVAVVGEPSMRQPRPGLVLRPRANAARRRLSALEVAYLEAVTHFDSCAELDWPDALHLTAQRADHRRHLRTHALNDVANTERGAGAALARSRLRELCAVVDGAPPPTGSVADTVPPRRRGEALTAAHLPAWMAAAPGSRIAALSSFVNHWALHPERRLVMCAATPHGPNRLDLVRIAATVHALCDRDGVAVPEWVWAHAWHEHVRIYDVGPASAAFRASALATCAHHRVWFREDHITCIRVHGMWNGKGPQ